MALGAFFPQPDERSYALYQTALKWHYEEILSKQAPTMVLAASDYYQAFCSLR